VVISAFDELASKFSSCIVFNIAIVGVSQCLDHILVDSSQSGIKGAAENPLGFLDGECCVHLPAKGNGKGQLIIYFASPFHLS